MFEKLSIIGDYLPIWTHISEFFNEAFLEKSRVFFHLGPSHSQIFNNSRMLNCSIIFQRFFDFFIDAVIAEWILLKTQNPFLKRLPFLCYRHCFTYFFQCFPLGFSLFKLFCCVDETTASGFENTPITLLRKFTHHKLWAQFKKTCHD